MTTADNMTVTATATEYTVSAVPETHRDHHLFAITVAYRGNGLWAVCRHGMCLGANGEWDWDWEPIQPQREDDPRVGWDEAEEGRPAPDCPQGLWLEASRWQPEHGQPDGHGYVVAPAGARCVGCGQNLPPYEELIGPVSGSDGLHFQCGSCACYLDEED